MSGLPGDPRHLEPNVQIRLDPPQRVLLVTSGRIGIYSIRLTREGTPGRRELLFECEPGEGIFPFDYWPNDMPFVIRAIPIERSEVWVFGVKEWAEFASEKPERVRALAEPWTRSWERALARVNPEFMLTAAMMQSSIVQEQQLHEQAPAPEILLPQPDLSRPLPLIPGLVERLVGLEDTRFQEEAVMLGAQTEQSQLQTARAITQLAKVLSPERSEPLIGDALFLAANAVAEAGGFEVVPPDPTFDFSRVATPLEGIARASKLRMREVRLREGWWRKEAGPLVSQSGDRPIALIPTQGRSPGYELYDPVQGIRRKVTASSAKEIAPIAYMLYRPFPEGKVSLIDLMRFSLAGRRGDMTWLWLVSLITVLLNMAVPVATALLIDEAIPAGDRNLLFEIFGGLLVAVVGVGAFRLAQGLLALRIESVIDAATQAAVWDRLLRLPPRFFKQFTAGDLSQRVNSITAIRRILGGMTLAKLLTSFLAAFNFGLLLYLSPTLAGVALVTGLLVTGLTVVVGLLVMRTQRELQEHQAEVYGFTIQFASAIPKLRVAGAETRTFAEWAKRYQAQMSMEYRNQRLNDGQEVINGFLAAASTIVTFHIAAGLIMEGSPTGGLSTGEFLAFNAALGTFVAGLTSLGTTVTDVLSAAILYERARPILNAEPEMLVHRANPGQLAGALELRGVSFRYRSDGPLILDDVSLKVKAGSMVALVGPSGCGKSTILRLMAGLEGVDTGAVLLDDMALAGLDLEEVRRQMGIVLQFGQLTSGSIYDNLCGDLMISRDEATQAIEEAGMAADLAEMPMGIDTMVSEGGTNLSGGQRQRLLIAKALAKDPKILLFDEATSALDNRSQAIVTASLERRKVTRVVSAHRLSTIRDADYVYVIDQGKVVQEGTLESLSEQGGLFERLISRQRVEG